MAQTVGIGWKFVVDATFFPCNESATPTMTDDSLLSCNLPAVQRKKVTATLDGGLMSSDGVLFLLREAERRLRLGETPGGCIRDRRNRARVVLSLAAMLRFRLLAVARGYEDAQDCDALRADRPRRPARLIELAVVSVGVGLEDPGEAVSPTG